MKNVKKVLVAVNGSMGLVNEGIRLARDEKSWVTVLKVVPPNEGDMNLIGVTNIADVLDSGAGRAAAAIKGLAASEGALIKTRVEEGEIDKKIVEVAEEERCDLIIMGAQKRGFLKRIFGLNIVEKVISQAPCPVLVLDA
jgi:nucleotide-binding universal stress UspA family protein